MKLTLQQHYDLIKKGQGTKDIFLKEAKSLFPQYVPSNASVDSAISSLKYKGIISESAPVKTEQTDWFKLFETKMAEAKAEEKNPTKEVVDMETRGFDYKDKDNIDNVYGQAFLTGLYAEMNDIKNKEKELDDLKKIVAKNLKKDCNHYVKDGQFGVKGLGYTQYPSDKSLKESMYAMLGGESPFDDSTMRKMIVEPNLGPNYKAYIMFDEPKGEYDKMKAKYASDTTGWKNLYRSSSYQGYANISPDGKVIKASILGNGGIIGAIYVKDEADDETRKKMINYVKGLKENKPKINEGYGMSLEDAKAEAQRIATEEGVVQHVEETRKGSGEYRISDWYDSDLTVATYDHNGTLSEDNNLTKESHTDNPDDIYYVVYGGAGFYEVWEGDVKIKGGFLSKEEAQKHADMENEKDGLAEGIYHDNFEYRMRDKVRINRDLTSDPLNKQGQIGILVGYLLDSDTAEIEFEDGETGLYQMGTFKHIELEENMDKPLFKTPIKTINPDVSSIMDYAYEEYISLHPMEEIDFVEWLKSTPEGQKYFTQAQTSLKETLMPYKVGDVLFDEEKNQTIKITRIEGDKIFAKKYNSNEDEYEITLDKLTVDESKITESYNNFYYPEESGLNVYPSTPDDLRELLRWLPTSDFYAEDLKDGDGSTYLFFPEEESLLDALEMALQKEFDMADISVRFEMNIYENKSLNENLQKRLKETQNIDDFIDVLVDMAIENNIISSEDINDNRVRDALYDVWDEMGFEDYKETGQGISTSDYNGALEMFKNMIKSSLNENLQKRLKEIEQQSEVTAVESKLSQIDEEISKRQNKLNMVAENDDLAELVDKKATAKLKKEIKLLEKKKKQYTKIYEKITKKSKKELLDESDDQPTEEQLSQMKDELESYVDTVGNYEEAVDMYIEKHPEDEKHRTTLLGLAEPLF